MPISRQIAGFIAIVTLAANMAACVSTGGAPVVDVEATVAAGVAATSQASAGLQSTVDAAVAATLQAQPPTPQPTATPIPIPATPIPVSTPVPDTPNTLDAPDLERVQAVIMNEVNGTVAQDLDFLQSLFAPDAVIIDHSGTPNDPADDTLWQGWPNIERRYQAFFSSGVSSITLVDLVIQVLADQAVATHQGVILDGTLYPDRGVYLLEKSNGQWLITQMDYGNLARDAGPPAGSSKPPPTPPTRDDGLYVLEVGSQHRYEEPWGWDRGDPCTAWETRNFDDTKPYYRGFNVELLLTNKSDEKIPDNWPITFVTHQGQPVQACFYGYAGSGPPPDTTSSVTFFTVVEQGDYVETITFSYNGQTVRLCLDGRGGWRNC